MWGVTLTAKELDTIYANEKMNTALFFPESIRQGIVGNSNFVFTFNREEEQSLGLLKAVKGDDSNLLVITKDGNIYSYIVSYSDKLDELNYFIESSERIGNEKRNVQETSSKSESTKSFESTQQTDSIDIKATHDMNFIEKSCASLLKLPERMKVTKRTDGISLGIKNLVYHENLVYVQLEVRNESSIDFDTGVLKVYRINGNKKRKASYQELELKPIYVYGMSNKIAHGQTIRFVCVFPKFVLDSNEKLLAKLFELNTSRSVSFNFGKPF